MVDGLLAAGCTVLVPAFADDFLVAPPPGRRPGRNGWDYDFAPDSGPAGSGLIYTPATGRIDRDMGAVAAEVVGRPGRARGEHPLNSFAAVGPLAGPLTARQRPLAVFGPLRGLAEADGFVVLMGVGPERLTLIHLAEALAGRQPFRRWANGPDGRPMMCATGGCSEGFGRLEPTLALHGRDWQVGASRWRAFPARATLEALAAAIRQRPEVTRCVDRDCARCRDAIAGGPILPGEGG